MNASEFYSDFQNDPCYVELQERLSLEGVILGGAETLEELIELAEEVDSEASYHAHCAGFYSW